MIDNYVASHYETETRRTRFFQDKEYEKGAGYSFDVDDNGNIVCDPEYADIQKENLEYCKAHPERYIDEGIQIESWKYKENAKGTCHCGTEIELYDEYMGACECPNCGQWYNLFGQELLPPKMWED